MHCVHMYMKLTQTNITIMLMLLFAARTVKLFTARQGIFKPAHIVQLKAEFFSGKKELALKIWYLLMFQMWYEKWMES